jgi:hypothetical protein
LLRKGPVDGALGNWRISHRRYDGASRATFQNQVLPDSYDESFTGKNLSRGAQEPCASTEWPPGRLPGSFFECAKTVFDENSLVTILHLPDSSDLAPSDLWLFGQIKISLAGRVFNDVGEVLEAVPEF